MLLYRMGMSGQGFTFRRFSVRQDKCAMKVGTDGVLLGAWAAGGRNILDVGTGTGLIALMMAQRFEKATVCGIDTDEDACRQAQENISESPFARRIEIEHVRLQDFSARISFDSIVSNPPFFTDSLKCPDARRSVARLLTEDGVLSVVIPTEAEKNFCAEASIYGMLEIKRCVVKTVPRKSPKRMLLSFARRRVGECVPENVCLFDDDGNKSEWYRSLTEDFYIK